MQMDRATCYKYIISHLKKLNTHTCRLVDGTSMNEECVAVDAVGSMPKLQPRVDRQVCAVRFFLREKTSRPVVPRLQRNILRTQWHGRSETIGEYGRHMESVAEVPEKASGLRQPRFWIRVFLLLDRLPAKANEPCLPTHTHTHTYTHNCFTSLLDFVRDYQGEPAPEK